MRATPNIASHSNRNQMAHQQTGMEIDARQFPAQREFALPAEPESISDMVDGIMAFIAQSGCATGKEPEISLALQEALANAVIHGAGGDASKTVYCTVGCSPTEGVVIVVRDPGSGFDPDEVKNPLSATGLTAEHGRGVHLIRELMDDVKYERNGTQLTMRKK
jgi:serine/threonine-protein kinase RsbW